MSAEDARLATRLRVLVRAVVVVALATAIVGALPGTRHYADVNHCAQLQFTDAMTNVFGENRGQRHEPLSCTPSYTRLVGTDRAGGWPVGGFMLAVVLGGLLVYRRPRRPLAWAWAAWSLLAAVGMAWGWFALYFELDLFGMQRSIDLWPAEVVPYGVLAVLALTVVGAPITALVTPRPRTAG